MRKRNSLEAVALAPRAKRKKAPEAQSVPVVLDQLLTVPQAAARLGIGRTKLYDLINTNQLPYVEIPSVGESAKRISALTLNSWIKSRETVKHPS
jgi:excisionase family DNA binding protein